MWIDAIVVGKCQQALTVISWIPEHPLVVLGRGNDPGAECFQETCRADSVPVLRRRGGGGAVVLHPGCVVISVGTWVSHYYKSSEYFQLINKALIDTLSREWPELTELRQEGISDLTHKGRKVAGTSLFRSRNYLLYQASLLVEARLQLIERYLKHPSREPEYRSGKSHSDFLSSLSSINPAIHRDAIKGMMENSLPQFLRASLEEELINPVSEQIPHLLHSNPLTEALSVA